MKNSLLFILIATLFVSCKVTEAPEFKKVIKIDVIDTSFQNFTLQADVLFLNKNSLGGTLQANDIHVFVDSIDVAIISSAPFDVPKKSEFTIPLKAIVPLEKVFNNNRSNLLNNIMNVISKKKINIRFTGKIRYKLGAFHYDYPLDYQQEINLRKR